MLLMIIGYLACFGLSLYIFLRSHIKEFKELTVRDLVAFSFLSSAGPVSLLIALIVLVFEGRKVSGLMGKVVYKKKEEE